MSCTELFVFFLKISASTFGGGMVFLGMTKEVLGTRSDISADTLDEIFSVAGTLPGPIAGATSYMVGYHYGGYRGACCAVLGMVIPPFFTIVALGSLVIKYGRNPALGAFFAGVLCASAALVAKMVYTSARRALVGTGAVLSFVITCALIIYCRWHPMAAMAAGVSAHAAVLAARIP